MDGLNIWLTDGADGWMLLDSMLVLESYVGSTWLICSHHFWMTNISARLSCGKEFTFARKVLYFGLIF